MPQCVAVSRAMPGKTLFALNDTATARAAWVAHGGRFGDYVVADFENATDTLLFDQENVFPLKDGITYRINPTVLPDGTHRYNIAIEQRDAEGRVDRLSAPAITARAAQPFSIHVGEYGFTFAPRQ